MKIISEPIDADEIPFGSVFHDFDRNIYYQLVWKDCDTHNNKFYLIDFYNFSVVDEGYNLKKLLSKNELLDHDAVEIIPPDKIELTLFH